MNSTPRTIGTAGHVDHGKTSLVLALTGTDTDRLPQEKQRGISIELGFAQLGLGDGRAVSLVDVPGHERFVRTMVAGATGVDAFLMVIAADDGVMPQTVEHAAVLAALDVRDGVVAVTKSDLADPGAAAAAAGELLPGAAVVPCSTRTGEGVEAVRGAVRRVCDKLPDIHHDADEPIVLHVDRSFSIRGAGTVVTGTLWSGVIVRGAWLTVLPDGRRVRVRGVQVHDTAVDRALCGQRVAINLAGVDVASVPRGSAITGEHDRWLQTSTVFDACLDVRDVHDRDRVQLHHGTRQTAARIRRLDGRLWRIRTERPLLIADRDRFVVRSIAPPDTLGGGTVVRPEIDTRSQPALSERMPRRASAPTEPPPDWEGTQEDDATLERVLLGAAFHPPTSVELGPSARGVPALIRAGRAVRLDRSHVTHPAVLAEVRLAAIAVIAQEGSLTVARLRDALDTSRRCALAFLHCLDAERTTLRLPDDRRVLRRRTRPSNPTEKPT